MLFFSPAVISVSVVCVVSLCDSYRACFLLGSNLKVNQLKSWSSAHRKSLKLCDWMVVSEMHLGRRSWLLQYQAPCSFDVLSKNPVFSVHLLFWWFSSRTESPPPFIRTWTGLFNELNGMEWTWVLSGWWNRVSVTLCSLVVGMISVLPAEKLQDWRDSQIHGCNLFGVLSAVARVHSAAPPPAAHRGLMTYETTRHQPGKNKLKIYRRHRHIGSVSQTISFICIEGFPLSFHLAWEVAANEIQLDDRVVDWNSSLWNVCYIFDKFVCEAQHGWNCISQLTWSFFNQISVFIPHTVFNVL